MRIDLIVKAGEVLDSDELSEDFYDHYKAELETVKKILSLWVIYSRDVSKVKLWNNAMRTEIRDPVTKMEKFDPYVFGSEPPRDEKPGPLSLTIKPSIFQSERGMAFVDFDRSIGFDPGLQLDIPIVGRPGTSLEVLTKDAGKFIEVVGNLLEQYDTRVLQNDIQLYLIESILRHEIKDRWFHDSMPGEIPNALARYALARFLAKSADSSQHAEIYRKMSLISPATPDLPQLFRDLTNLKWDELPQESASAEVRRAYSYFLMGAMLQREQSGLWEVFRRLPETKLEKPSEFFAHALEVFPEFETGFSVARDWQLNELESSIAKSEKGRKKTTPEAKRDSSPPAHYETSQFEGLTIQHPKFLREAVAEIGPAWGKALGERRKGYNEAISKRPWTRIQKVTDQELDRFEALGLKRPPRKTADQWAELLVKLAEADRLFSVLFTDKIHVWTKEDVQEILRNGGKLDGFSLNEEEGSVHFNASLSHILNGLSYDDMKKPGAMESMGTIMMPMLLKEEEIDGKSKDELVRLLNSDEFLGALQKDDISVEQLARALGMPLLGMSEEFCFLVLIHELAESLITERLIASGDRRWFTDGMATYLAAEMTGKRFGDKEAGWKQLEKMYRSKPAQTKTILPPLKLFEWKAGEVENRLGQGSPTKLSNARYLYSAKAIRKAVQGQGDEFVKRWFNEIAKTRWNRATSQTVIDAYGRLTGGDLRKLVESVAGDDLPGK